MRHAVTEGEWIDITINVKDTRPPNPPGMTDAEVEEMDRRIMADLAELFTLPVTTTEIRLLGSYPPGFVASCYEGRR